MASGRLRTDGMYEENVMSSLQTNALISGHPGGGVTPGIYRGIARDLLAFVTNVWPRTGALDVFCTSEARYTGKDPRDL